MLHFFHIKARSLYLIHNKDMILITILIVINNSYLLIIQSWLNYVPRILLGTDDTVFNKPHQNLVFEMLMFYLGVTDYKQK